MKSLVRKIPLILLLVILAGLTYRKEYHSRDHLDTLREESFMTIRVIGIPIWRSEQHVSDRYQGLYTRITGKQPDSNHWKVSPPDYVRTVHGSMYLCYGSPFELQVRRQLIVAVYDKFKLGMPREKANELIQRIEQLCPTEIKSGQSLDFEAVNSIRKELGLDEL